jgi:hypothetical protein
MDMPSAPNANTRVIIAFLCLFAVMVALSVGAYFAGDLGKLQERLSARESQAALQGITEPAQIEEALKQHPSNKLVQMMAMATTAANETNAAIENLSNEIEPPAISKADNLGTAKRNELEALRRELKTAEANATAFLPRYVAVLKSERDNVEKYARSLHLGKDTLGRLLDDVDKRHMEITALASRMLAARADYYRAYEAYVAVLVREFGAYKVVNGEFIFPFQPTVNRYNAAADAMTAAARRITDLQEERKTQLQAQQERWLQLVNGN